MRNNKFYYKINEVANILDVSPATIRNWEKSKLFIARRNKSNYRQYDSTDLELLKKIKYLSIEKKMNIVAIKKLLQLDTTISTSEMFLLNIAQGGELDADDFAPIDWKNLRNKKNLTLEEVSKIIGVSISYLSKIESNTVNPSFEILTTLSNFYDVELFNEINKNNTILNKTYLTKKEERTPFDLETPGVFVENLVSMSHTIMRPTMFTVLPSHGQSIQIHIGEAFIHIIEGEITFVLYHSEEEGTEYILKPGDSLNFQCKIPHSWQNKTDRKASFIWVHTQISLD